MVAQVAMQGGTYVGKFLKKGLPKNYKPFKYFDKGSMATIGRNKAVADLKVWNTQGFIAWVIWMFIHPMSLVGFANKIRVFMSWAYSYFSSDKRFRLIIRPHVKENEPEALRV
jgi:NADH dehydrogenase